MMVSISVSIYGMLKIKYCLSEMNIKKDFIMITETKKSLMSIQKLISLYLVNFPFMVTYSIEKYTMKLISPLIQL